MPHYEGPENDDTLESSREGHISQNRDGLYVKSSRNLEMVHTIYKLDVNICSNFSRTSASDILLH